MDNKETKAGSYQQKKSKAIVDAIKRTTNQDLMNVKLKNEQFQKQTYAEDILRQQVRQQEILEEAKSSAAKNLAMEMNWGKLKELDECEELHQQIQEQLKSFQDIINGKQHLIKEFWEELKKKDDSYIKMLKEQQVEIKDIINNMRVQYQEIRDANLRELVHIEASFEKERADLLDLHKKQIQSLFQRHQEEEDSNFQQHLKRDNDNYENIEELRILGAKQYAKTKIEMEGEIQNLQKCLEDMNALYILNTEKLDYNLKVLKEKNDENKSLQEELKRKDGLLQNRLRILTNDYNNQKIEFRKRNKLLTQEYKRITLQFMELQKKFKHFEKADSLRYTEIQKMNEEEVRKYKSKIEKCDITIHIQQLGRQWVPMEENQEDKEQTQLQIQSPEKEFDQEENKLAVSEQKLKEIINIILVEADFLIDDRTTENLGEMNEFQKISSRLEIIKKCLGIDDSFEEFNIFLKDFLKFCRFKNEELPIEEDFQQQNEQQKQNQQEDQKDQKKKEKKGGKEQEKAQDEEILEKQQQQLDEDEEEEDLEEIQDYEVLEINKNKVIQFLNKWLKDTPKRKKKLEKMNNNKQQKQESERERKERIARKGKQYWENLTNVLPAKTFRIWKVLDKSLSKYYELLLSRQKIIEETGELHNQNEELKNLLNQYLQINHELQIPPTRLINLEQN